MENNNGSSYNETNINNPNNAGAANEDSVRQENSSAYGYSYINQEQKNPNNIWRADDYTSSTDTAGAYASQSGAYGTSHADSVYGSTQSGMDSSYSSTQSGMDSSYSSTQSSADSSYSSTQSGAGSAYSNIYGSPNGQGGYQTYDSDKKQKKEARARKRAERQAARTAGSSSFGIKVAKCASIALVFGLVAGTTFEGSSYLAGSLLGTNEEKEEKVINEDREVLNTPDSTDKTAEQLSAPNSNSSDGVVPIVKQCMPSIVAITNLSVKQTQDWFGQVRNYEVPSAGSGIIISEDDSYLYIVTNNHVVSAATTLTIQFCDSTTAAAEIKGTDRSTDLAVVQVKKDEVEAETLSAIKLAILGDSDKIEAGSQAIAIGNALGYGQSVTAGYISAVEREVTIEDETTGESFTNDLIQTDAAINPGNSGGALLNCNGEVIGINSSKYSDTTVEGMGFAIPSNMARPIIEDLITKEEVSDEKAAYLGISGQGVASSVTQAYNIPQGIYVKEVSRGTAAEKYGLQQGDIITKFDGRDVRTMEDLKKRLSYYEGGAEVEITIQRPSEGGYEEKTLSVVLGKKNS